MVFYNIVCKAMESFWSQILLGTLNLDQMEAELLWLGRDWGAAAHCPAHPESPCHQPQDAQALGGGPMHHSPKTPGWMKT